MALFDSFALLVLTAAGLSSYSHSSTHPFIDSYHLRYETTSKAQLKT